MDQAPHLPPKDSTQDHRRIVGIVIATFFGLLGGVVGALLAVAYLVPSAAPFGYGVTVGGANRFIVDATRLSAMRQVTVTFVRPQSFSTSSPFASRIIDPQDRIGYGVSVTADGWLMTENSVAAIKGASVVLPDGKIVDVQKKVTDPLTGLTFVKVDGANISVAPFGKISLLPVGSPVIYPAQAAAGQMILRQTNAPFCESVACAANRLSEELYTGGLVAADELATAGAPVFSEKGEIVGMVRKGGSEDFIIPTSFVTQVLDQVIRHGEIKRPQLGVKFVDLGRTPVVGLVGAERRGAAVIGFRKTAAKSAAQAAGIKLNDLIVSIEGEPLGLEKTLPEILATYNPGQKINLEVLRGKEEIKLAVTLGE